MEPQGKGKGAISKSLKAVYGKMGGPDVRQTEQQGGNVLLMLRSVPSSAGSSLLLNVESKGLPGWTVGSFLFCALAYPLLFSKIQTRGTDTLLPQDTS